MFTRNFDCFSLVSHVLIPDDEMPGNQKPKHLFSKWIGIHLEQESDKIRHDAIRYSSSMNFE